MNIKFPLGIGMIQQWLRSFEPEPFLHLLKESGIHFIEIYASLRQWEVRKNWLDMALKEGLYFTLHGPYHGPYEITSFEIRGENATRNIFLETFDKVAQIACREHMTTRVNLHGAMSTTLSEKILFEKTIEFIKWLIIERDERGWPFSFVVELLPHSNDKTRIGTGITDLIRILREVGSGLEGFCWDLGHFRRNELMGHENLIVPEFIENVRHVHIHDINNMDIEFDHCPLIFREVPYEDYLGLLKGKNISLVLEMNYLHTQMCGDPRQELLASIRKVQKARDTLIRTL